MLMGIPVRLGGDLTTSRELTRQRALAEFGTFALRHADAPDLFDEAVRQIAHATQLPHIVIALHRPEEGDFLAVALEGVAKGPDGPVRLDGGPRSAAERARLTAQPVLIPDARQPGDLDLSEPARHAGHGTVAAVPIPKAGSVAGVIEIGAPDPRSLDIEDVYVVEALAYMLGAALARMEAEAERDALLEVLRERERRYRFMAESIPHIVWTAGADGTVDYYNGRWTEYTGLSVADGVAGKWSEIIHPDDQAATVRAWTDAVTRAAPYEIEHRIRRADGGWRWMLSRAWPLRNDKGAVVRWFGTATDVDAERQVREALLDARDAAERANRAKSRFLAAASHDLRQPLNAVTLLMGVLRSRIADLEALEIVERIEGSLEAMIELFEALLDLSKLESGAVSLDIRMVPLNAVLQRLERDFAPAAAAKGLRFRMMPTSAWVATDATLLERMLRNLVSNAVRYTELGGVLIGARVRDDIVHVEIVDTGPGIPPEHRDEIFDEFRQLHNEARERGGGHGLGLAIVRRASALLRHPVGLDSRLGHGSRFTVTLPRVPPDEIAVEREKAMMAPCAPAEHTVLVIEDDSLVLTATKLLLEQYGCAVVPARTATEALETVDGGLRPSAILADFRLPGGVDGLQAIAMLRASLGREVPAVLVTGDVTDQVEPRARSQNVHLLRKPVKPEELAGLVRNPRHDV